MLIPCSRHNSGTGTPPSAWRRIARIARICGSLNLLVFHQNLLDHIAEKILLLKPINWWGDYPSSWIHRARKIAMRHFCPRRDSMRLLKRKPWTCLRYDCESAANTDPDEFGVKHLISLIDYQCGWVIIGAGCIPPTCQIATKPKRLALPARGQCSLRIHSHDARSHISMAAWLMLERPLRSSE